MVQSMCFEIGLGNKKLLLLLMEIRERNDVIYWSKRKTFLEYSLNLFDLVTSSKVDGNMSLTWFMWKITPNSIKPTWASYKIWEHCKCSRFQTFLNTKFLWIYFSEKVLDPLFSSLPLDIRQLKSLMLSFPVYDIQQNESTTYRVWPLFLLKMNRATTFGHTEDPIKKKAPNEVKKYEPYFIVLKML